MVLPMDRPLQMCLRVYCYTKIEHYLVFCDPVHVRVFFYYFNSKHPGMKFTTEIGQNSTVYFQDCLINKGDNAFQIAVYRQPIATGYRPIFIHSSSLRFKLNAVRTLND